MDPETLEGQILRDADKIDWVTVSRWQTWIDAGDFKRLRRMSSSLAWIRNEVLHLEPSRQIFDRELSGLRTWIRGIDDPALEEPRRSVLEYRG